MPPLTKLYTRAGDKGSTRLGGGQIVTKNSLRLECYGTIDELNSHLGLAVALGASSEVAACLQRIQNELFDIGSDMCFLDEDKSKWPIPQPREDQIDLLEREIDGFQSRTGPLTNFILPGGAKSAAALHVARTVCRRLERMCVQMDATESVNPITLRYINRLSDWLFAAPRLENQLQGIDEPLWKPGA